MRGEHLDSDRDGDHTVLWPPLHFGALPYTGNLWHLLESTWAPEAVTWACFPQRLQVIQVGKLITQDHRFADMWSSLLWGVYILGSGLCFGFSWSVFFFLILQITYICNFFSWSGDGTQDLVFTGQDLSLRATPVPLMFALYLFFFFFFLMIFLFCNVLHSLASDSFSDLHSSAAFPVSHLVPLPGCLEEAVVSSPTASHPAASTVHSSHRAVAPVALGFRELSNLPFLDVLPRFIKSYEF